MASGPTDLDAAFARRRRAAHPQPGTPADDPAVARTLSAAFAHDPQLDWVLRPGPGRDTARLEFFRMILGVAHAGAGLVCRAEDNSCAAIWARPDQAGAPLPVMTELMILPRLLRATGWGRFGRAWAARSAMDRHHPKAPAHWYLMFIGVDPAFQGQGLGGALLAATLAEIDAQGSSAYLEASTQNNRRLYERHGFVTQAEIRARADAPPMWAMWRPPQP